MDVQLTLQRMRQLHGGHEDADIAREAGGAYTFTSQQSPWSDTIRGGNQRARHAVI
jgi:hypothetical protein